MGLFVSIYLKLQTLKGTYHAHFKVFILWGFTGISLHDFLFILYWLFIQAVLAPVSVRPPSQ